MKCLFKPRNVLLFTDTVPTNFTESVFPAFVSSPSSQGSVFPMQQQVGVEYTKETSDKFQGILLLLNE